MGVSPRHSYEVSEISSAASVHRRSHNASKVSREGPPSRSPAPTSDHANNTAGSYLSSQKHDPALPALLSNEKVSQPRLNFYDQSFTNGWGWELLAWLLATASLLALVAIFAVFSNKPLGDWHSRLSPNTIVSVLSQVGQTAVLLPVTSCLCQSMWIWLGKEDHVTSLKGTNGKRSQLIDMQAYDDGSRGPIGSLLLLWKHPGRLLVWLGTVSTVFIFLFGAFAQQTLQLPSRPHNINSEGSIRRSLRYRADPLSDNTFTGPDFKNYPKSPPLRVIGAITDGLVDSGASPSNVSGSCPTGNCTFGTYQSMGVCSSIVDVSSSITSKCRRTGDATNLDHIIEPGCNYTVPAISKHPTVPDTVFQTSNSDTFWMGASTILDGYTYPNNNTLVQLYVIYAPDLNKWRSFDDIDDHKGDLIALQVTLNLCLYTYNTTMTLGVTDTQEVSRSNISEWRYIQDNNGTVIFDTVSTSQNGETFAMDQRDVEAFNNYLSAQTFVGKAQMVGSKNNWIDSSYDTDAAFAIASSIYGQPAGMQGLAQRMDNFATGLTNALRTTSDIIGTQPGIASTFEVYIQIVWPWMIVPIASILLSLIFLVLTMSVTKRRKIPVLKSSLLATLLGLDTDTRRELGAITSAAAMEKHAGKRNVRLESDGTEWHIVKED